MQIQDPPPSAMPLRRLKTSSEQQQQQQALKCPRCHSLNTKFCYFNNYNQSQPRHFCKSCRRYWTEGGALRNVPVGGGCRKNKRVLNKGQHRPESGNITPAISGANTILVDLPPFYNGGQIDLSSFARLPEGLNLSDDQPSLADSCSMQGMFGSSRLPSLGIDFPANLCSETRGEHVFSLNGMHDWRSYQEKDENQGHACMLRSSLGEEASCVTDSQWLPSHDQAFYGHTAEIDYCAGWPDLVQ